MHNYFREAKAFLEKSYPELHGNVEGGIYPPPAYATLLANIAGYLWTIGILLIMGGSQIFKALNMEEPEPVKWITNNKGSAFIALFLINNIANSMVATGAFEIYLDDIRVFSKLMNGRFPSVQDLIEIFKEQGLYPA